VALQARRLHLRIPAGLPAAVDPDTLADPRTGQLPAAAAGGEAVHDVFVWRGLGGVAGLLYARLERAAPVTVRLLAARTGWRRETMRRHLRRLARHGLAAIAAGGGWIRGEADLDEVAAELGTAGTLTGRAEEYVRQRAAYLNRWAIVFANRGGYREQRGIYRPAQRRLPLGLSPAPPGAQQAVSAA
jgi:hypothetical protein